MVSFQIETCISRSQRWDKTQVEQARFSCIDFLIQLQQIVLRLCQSITARGDFRAHTSTSPHLHQHLSAPSTSPRKAGLGRNDVVFARSGHERGSADEPYVQQRDGWPSPRCLRIKRLLF